VTYIPHTHTYMLTLYRVIFSVIVLVARPKVLGSGVVKDCVRI
jgi:hypothetical protein